MTDIDIGSHLPDERTVEAGQLLALYAEVLHDLNHAEHEHPIERLHHPVLRTADAQTSLADLNPHLSHRNAGSAASRTDDHPHASSSLVDSNIQPPLRRFTRLAISLAQQRASATLRPCFDRWRAICSARLEHRRLNAARADAHLSAPYGAAAVPAVTGMAPVLHEAPEYRDLGESHQIAVLDERPYNSLRLARAMDQLLDARITKLYLREWHLQVLAYRWSDLNQLKRSRNCQSHYFRIWRSALDLRLRGQIVQGKCDGMLVRSLFRVWQSQWRDRVLKHTLQLRHSQQGVRACFRNWHLLSVERQVERHHVMMLARSALRLWTVTYRDSVKAAQQQQMFACRCMRRVLKTWHQRHCQRQNARSLRQRVLRHRLKELFRRWRLRVLKRQHDYHARRVVHLIQACHAVRTWRVIVVRQQAYRTVQVRVDAHSTILFWRRWRARYQAKLVAKMLTRRAFKRWLFAARARLASKQRLRATGLTVQQTHRLRCLQSIFQHWRSVRQKRVILRWNARQLRLASLMRCWLRWRTSLLAIRQRRALRALLVRADPVADPHSRTDTLKCNHALLIRGNAEILRRTLHHWFIMCGHILQPLDRANISLAPRRDWPTSTGAGDVLSPLFMHPVLHDAFERAAGPAVEQRTRALREALSHWRDVTLSGHVRTRLRSHRVKLENAVQRKRRRSLLLRTWNTWRGAVFRWRSAATAAS